MRKLLGLVLLMWCATTVGAQMPEIVLTVHGQKLITEVASTDTDRAQGLMHRRMLPENRGMLFVFPESAIHGMWMMNTYVPLSVAFIDDRGVIINIEDMQPHTQNAHNAARPAKFALEANLGWYRKHGIKPGDRIEGLQQAPAAR
ncbi:MAG TPA: DUF192 domain-containing protein [Burkholderiales bacterium]|nr:DUF192 domain-containing protein [Burkholderiales bacterium]